MPTSHSLDDLIRDKAADFRADLAYYAIDWNERLTWWQSCIDRFYVDVISWFQTLIDEKVIVATRKPIQLREEFIGEYSTETLTLAIETLTFDIVPVETNTLGGFGHIKLVGTAGTAKLLLCPTESTPSMLEQRETAEWYFVHSQSDRKLYGMDAVNFKGLYATLMSIGT